MDKLIDQLSLSFEDSISPLNFIAYILLCAILLYLLSRVYEHYGQSISNRSQLAKVLMIVGLTTFIIISIVKSSLALSLGLVGALSIVRFRTAIKEPEELGYFFMAIAMGLGMGANQLLPTVIGFIILMGIVILQHKGSTHTVTQNLLINLECEPQQKTAVIKKISDIVNATANQLEVKRIKHQDTVVSINFMLKVDSLEDLNKINEQLIEFDSKIQVTFIDNTL